MRPHCLSLPNLSPGTGCAPPKKPPGRSMLTWGLIGADGEAPGALCPKDTPTGGNGSAGNKLSAALCPGDTPADRNVSSNSVPPSGAFSHAKPCTSGACETAGASTVVLPGRRCNRQSQPMPPLVPPGSRLPNRTRFPLLPSRPSVSTDVVSVSPDTSGYRPLPVGIG